MALVEHLDIYPTLADIAAIDIPAATMGRSMVGGNARRLERRDILRSTAHTEHGAHGTPNTDARMHRAHGARSTEHGCTEHMVHGAPYQSPLDYCGTFQ